MGKDARSSEPAYMSPKQAADYYGVCLHTIMRWINAGKLAVLQPAGPRGRILIPR
jgi:excisionase family DNA binding protein